MTVLARRRIGMSCFRCEAVNAGIKTLREPCVTNRAIYQRHGFIVIRMLVGNIRVTTNAGICFVRRGGELASFDEQGNCFTRSIGLVQRVVAMTIQTIAVLQTGECRRGQDQQK